MIHGVRLLALAALLGCSNLTEVDAGIAAIEVTVPVPAVVHVGQSVRLYARALNRTGGVVPADIKWFTPDATTLRIDAGTGIVKGINAGTGRVQAVSGSFISGLVTLTVDSWSPRFGAERGEALRQAR